MLEGEIDCTNPEDVMKYFTQSQRLETLSSVIQEHELMTVKERLPKE